MRSLNKIIFTALLYSIMNVAYALANPAAVNCTDKGNQYVLIKNTGICIFKDGSYCEEWAFYRNTCLDGINYFPGGKFNEDRLSQYCVARKDGVTNVVRCR